MINVIYKFDICVLINLMDFILFAIVYPFIWITSRLPMRILYVISDVLFFLVYYIFGYRKKVVAHNIDLCFPEKNETEKNEIVKKFYKHFIDLMIESIKAFSISEKEIIKRYTYTNIEVLEKLIEKGKSIILVGAHIGNWEWSFYLPKMVSVPMYGAHTKLGNKYFEAKVKKSRTKFGGRAFKNAQVIKGIYDLEKKQIQALHLLLSDQSPQLNKTHYWRNFFNIYVPVHTGPEMIAKKFDLTVVNYVTKRTKRGYFETTFELITETPKECGEFEITDKYFEITERNIKEQPFSYLWSHKRFKHKDKYDEWLGTQNNKKQKTAS